VKTAAQWQGAAFAGRLSVARQAGTEIAFTGEYDRIMPTASTTACVAIPRFMIRNKFESGTGLAQLLAADLRAECRQEQR